MYQVENPINKAMQGMSGAAGTYGSMMKDIPANRDPGPTAGGAISAGMGGALAGAQIGSMLGGAGAAGTAAAGAGVAGAAATGAAAGAAGGPPGWLIGAAIGIGAYLLS